MSMTHRKRQIKRMFIPILGMTCAVFLLVWLVAPETSTSGSKAEDITFEDKNLALLEAAGAGDVIKTAYYLGNGADVNWRDKTGRTPLMAAAAGGHHDTVVILLQNGASSEYSDLLGEHALSLSAAGGHLEVVQTLLRYGAKIDAGYTQNNTALLKACANGHNAVVEFLLKNDAAVWPGKSMNCGPLVMALSNNHISTALLLLQNGCDYNEFDSQENNILQMAILCDSELLVKYILENCNYNLYHLNAQNENALAVGQRKGNKQIIELLESVH